MSDFKLEVGKRYEVRDPEYAKRRQYPTQHLIKERRPGLTFPMITESLHAYHEDGRYVSGVDYELDLVREVTP